MILSIIMILAVIFFITVTHEAGHLLAGKAFGITAFSFSVGMGPKLFSKKYNCTILVGGDEMKIPPEILAVERPKNTVIYANIPCG